MGVRMESPANDKLDSTSWERCPVLKRLSVTLLRPASAVRRCPRTPVLKNGDQLRLGTAINPDSSISC